MANISNCEMNLENVNMELLSQVMTKKVNELGFVNETFNVKSLPVEGYVPMKGLEYCDYGITEIYGSNIPYVEDGKINLEKCDETQDVGFAFTWKGTCPETEVLMHFAKALKCNLELKWSEPGNCIAGMIDVFYDEDEDDVSISEEEFDYHDERNTIREDEENFIEDTEMADEINDDDLPF